MDKIETNKLLEAGVHFGHLRKKWNPKMRPYIFMERRGIHIIDLNKTNEKLVEAASAMKSIARAGKKILFVATKKQATDIVTRAAQSVNMPYVTERWPGGMLTNFATIRKSIKKMQSIEKMLSDESAEKNITKKERLILAREKEKMQRVLGGIVQLNRLPAAVYIVDINHERIAVAEAQKLNITTIGMVDTNSDPTQVDFPVPANDDATKSIAIITEYLTEAVHQGLEERMKEKEKSAKEEEAAKTAVEKPAAEKTEETAPKKRTTRRKRATKKVSAEQKASETTEEKAPPAEVTEEQPTEEKSAEEK